MVWIEENNVLHHSNYFIEYNNVDFRVFDLGRDVDGLI